MSSHYPLYLRLSITDQCDLGCIYCTPSRRASARAADVLTAAEIAVLVRALALSGVTKVRLTGGEPLVRGDVTEIVRVISRTPGVRTLGLTTNGIALEGCARDLSEAGLNCVNISLDTLDRETCRKITGRDVLASVHRGIDAALRCGFEKVKLNTVVMRGVNDSEVPEIADIARRLPVEVRFIELMPLGHGIEKWRAMHVPASEIMQMLGDIDPLPYQIGVSARRFRLAGGGIVGIISPVTDNFCGGCNRLRVTCTGKLRPCLRLGTESDLRPLIGLPDLDGRLGNLIARLSRNKLARSFVSSTAVQAEAMCAIGG